MSMMEPFVPARADDEGGIPAADPGAGAPAPSEGFGVGGEEPDTTDAGPDADLEAEVERRVPKDLPFRTPDPGQER